VGRGQEGEEENDNEPTPAGGSNDEPEEPNCLTQLGFKCDARSPVSVSELALFCRLSASSA
jgi:hypothetical protein